MNELIKDEDGGIPLDFAIHLYTLKDISPEDYENLEVALMDLIMDHGGEEAVACLGPNYYIAENKAYREMLESWLLTDDEPSELHEATRELLDKYK